jgi:hypothetical protein
VSEDGDFLDINPDTLSWRTEGTKPGRRFSKEAWHLAKYLADSIEFWKPGYIVWKNKSSKYWQTTWAISIDKLLKTDVQVNEIKHVIDRMSRDKDQEHKVGGFSWRINILSGNKLVEKWEKLQIKYGFKTNKVRKEKRYYDQEPFKEGENPEDWIDKGEPIEPVF